MLGDSFIVELNEPKVFSNNALITVRPEPFVFHTTIEELCERQAARLYDAITTDTDLTSHLHDAVESLRIVSTTIAPEKLLSARDTGCIPFGSAQ